MTQLDNLFISFIGKKVRRDKIFFTSNPKYRKLKNVVFEGKYTKKYGFIFDDMHVLKFSFKKFINNIKF